VIYLTVSDITSSVCLYRDRHGASQFIDTDIVSFLLNMNTFISQLQFLFELPTRLKKCIDMEAYSQAVRSVSTCVTGVEF